MSLTNFRCSYVLTRINKDKMVADNNSNIITSVTKIIMFYLGRMGIKIFRKIQPYSGILRDIKAYWGIFTCYWRWSHNQTYSEVCVTLPYTIVPYSEMSYLEPEASSKACQTYKMSMHVQSTGIVVTVYSSILKDI